MPFLTSIRESATEYAEGSAERIVLDFLLENAVGRENAQPWSAIEAELSRFGFNWCLQKFQQGLLKKSREGEMYIGSNDHAPYRGYFIIADRADAMLMAEWYRKRISTEQLRLEHLENLVCQQWP